MANKFISADTGDILFLIGENLIGGGDNLTTQYRMTYVDSAGVLTESSSIVTDVSGNMGVGGSPDARLHSIINVEAHTTALILENSSVNAYSADLVWRTGYGSEYDTAAIRSEGEGAFGGNMKFRVADTSKVLQTRITIDNSGRMIFASMPTSDPLIAGALWSDSGTVKISAG
jgi:hypothetical protein